MLASSRLWVVSSIVFFASIRAMAATPVFLESPDGKRLVKMDSPELNQAYLVVSAPDSNKAIVYVGAKQILTDTHAPPIFVVDGDVRHTAAGVKIATFDGENIRHGDRGKIILNYHHPDISPSASANRIYRVNGPHLTATQLVAMLYVAQPDLFKLSEAEVAQQEKARAETAAEDARARAADQMAGNWMVLTGTGPVEKTGRGSWIISPKKSGAYPVAIDCSKNGGPTWSGVGFYKEMFGDKLFWLAYGTPKTVGLCVYEVDGGNLKGTWYPWYIDGDEKNIGTENLKGPESLDGDFVIESAKAPFSGAAYTGTVAIHPLKIVGQDDHQAPYSVTWTIGGKQISGIAIRHRKLLIVSSGTGADVNVAAYELHNGSITGDWYKLGSTEKGNSAVTKR